MTDAQRSPADARHHKVAGDVHLVLLDDDGRALLGRRKDAGFADGHAIFRQATWKQASQSSRHSSGRRARKPASSSRP